MLRSTFSTTTIASSTTMPMASTSPNRVSVLIEKPKSSMNANVPTIETGTATQRDDRGAPGLQEQDHDEDDEQRSPRTASRSPLDRVPHEPRRVVDDVVVDARREMRLLHLGHRAAHVVRELERVRAPGAWKMPIATAGLLLSSERSAYSPAPSSMRATSSGAVTPPSGVGLHDDLAELLFALTRRPWALTESWKSMLVGDGGAADHAGRRPARSARGCARTTSLAVRVRARELAADRATRASRSRPRRTRAPGPCPGCAPGCP